MLKTGKNKPKSTANPTYCRGIRGATTVSENTKDAILAATREMLYIIIQANNIRAGGCRQRIFYNYNRS
jgi:chorismate mutase